jgi:hypothetical protein
LGTASAQDKWVLWEDSGSSNRGVEIFDAKPECQEAALREARSTFAKTSGYAWNGKPELNGTKIRVPIEFEILCFSYDCYPDTVDEPVLWRGEDLDPPGLRCELDRVR